MNRKNLLTIITSSFILGFVFNFLNPKGIPLLYEKRIIEFAVNDSIIGQPTDNLSNSNYIDSTLLKSTTDSIYDSKNINQKQSNIKSEEFSKPLAIKINRAYQLYKQGVKFIDARMPEEFIEGHIKGAINIPFDGDETYRDLLKEISKDEIIVTYCSGTECDLSILLGEELFEKGYRKVYIFFGGWNEWLKKGYPIAKGEQ